MRFPLIKFGPRFLQPGSTPVGFQTGSLGNSSAFTMGAPEKLGFGARIRSWLGRKPARNPNSSDQLRNMNPQQFFAGTDVNIPQNGIMDPLQALDHLLSVRDIHSPADHAQGGELPYELHPRFHTSVRRVCDYIMLADNHAWLRHMETQLVAHGYHFDAATQHVDLRWLPTLKLHGDTRKLGLMSTPGVLTLTHPNGSERMQLRAGDGHVFLYVPPGESRVYLNDEALPFGHHIPLGVGDTLTIDRRPYEFLASGRVPSAAFYATALAEPTSTFHLDIVHRGRLEEQVEHEGAGFPGTPEVRFMQNRGRIWVVDHRQFDDTGNDPASNYEGGIHEFDERLMINDRIIASQTPQQLFEGDIITVGFTRAIARFAAPALPQWLARTVYAHSIAGTLPEAIAPLRDTEVGRPLAHLLGRVLAGEQEMRSLPSYLDIRQGMRRHMYRALEAAGVEPRIRAHDPSRSTQDLDLVTQYNNVRHGHDAQQQVAKAGSLRDLQRVLAGHEHFARQQEAQEAMAQLARGDLAQLQHIPADAGARQRARDLLEDRDISTSDSGIVPLATAATQGAVADTITSIARLLRESIHEQAQFDHRGVLVSSADICRAIVRVVHRGWALEHLPRYLRSETDVINLRERIEEEVINPTIAHARHIFPVAMAGNTNTFTGEHIDDNDLMSQYRFARALLFHNADRPVFHPPLPEESDALVAHFARFHPELSNYRDVQQFVRQGLEGNDWQAAEQLPKILQASSPDQRALIVEAFFGRYQHRDMPDIPTAIHAATMLGLSGIYREVGVALREEHGTLQPVISLGNMFSVRGEDAARMIVMHTHPEHYANDDGKIVGQRHDMQHQAAATMLGHMVSERVLPSTQSILFSRQDVRIYLKMAAAFARGELPESVIYNRQLGIFRNWVQHRFGGAEIEIHMDGTKPTEVVIRYAVNEHGHTELNKDYRAQREKLRKLLEDPKTWRDYAVTPPPVRFERLPSFDAFVERLPMADQARQRIAHQQRPLITDRNAPALED